MDARRASRGDSHGNLRNEVENMLSTAIVIGELAPGTLVTVPSLAAQFAVSATPVREAMVNLQHRGFVEPVRNKGFRVTHMSERETREITTVRAWLESSAMAAIAPIFPRDRIGEFRALADQGVRAIDEGDLAGYLDADQGFHREILRLLENERLSQLATSLRQETRLGSLASRIETPELRQSATEHHLILDRLMEADAAGLLVLVRDHVLRDAAACPH
ncbi:GntR family transcriptional regulator [Microbacterium sp. ASV49]|uniref:GntR family transcriptional regulator n=1 Tax=Microbacterium candidum TaxID=3041922 RepID=A0ABT7MUA0_9MICO|nr:GntR family transcriptional regulator [Microbacterium sp. ASV49]MDL9978003.1 GntR family transcriptional regulator [Microbacterium sp. ASV49]